MNDKLSLSTLLQEAQNFRLPKFFLAGFWIRLGAYLVDMILIDAMTAILLNLTLYRIFGLDFASSWIVTLIELIIFVCYFYFLTKHFDGQTPGKMLFGIRVVPLKGEADNTFYLMRELFGRVVFYYFPVIAVLLVFSAKNQHVIDMLADSVVIRKERVQELRDYLENEGGQADDYQGQGELQAQQG